MAFSQSGGGFRPSRTRCFIDLFLTLIDSKVNTFDVVDSWGLKGLFLASAEVDISPSLHYYYYAGLYANAGIFIRDLGKPTEERHGLLDLGMALPLSKSRKLQLILETNTTLRNQIPLQGNYTGLTMALRYVTSSFQLTGGIQRRLKQDDEDVEIEDTNPDRFVFLMQATCSDLQPISLELPNSSHHPIHVLLILNGRSFKFSISS
ncbi:MAG: hypothetical protein MPW15_20090 [Candidatus Manganitrophus sp.]|nr:hypothetical protein [Candidatus Manganitrophus sp.]